MRSSTETRPRPWTDVRRPLGGRAALAALLVLSFLLNVLNTGSGATCHRARTAVPSVMNSATRAAAIVTANQSSDSRSSNEHGPALAQSCGPVLALPPATASGTAHAVVRAAPIVNVRTLIASHDPPPLFRPPRVI